MDTEAGGPLTGWRFWLPSLAVYAAAVFVVSGFHEPWRDEADVWLMVRDNDLGALWELMRYSGTPGLWHLVLLPFVKLGFPYATQQVVHGLIAVAAAALLLARAPFPRPVRLLLVFSYYVGFEYAVVSRSYVLTMFLLFALAAVHTRRWTKPLLAGALLALLANTNAHGFLVACVLAAIAGVEWRRGERSRIGLVGLAVAGAGLVLAFAQLLPPEDGQARALLDADRAARLVGVFDRAFVPIGTIRHPWATAGGLFVNLAALLAASTFLVRSRPALVRFVLATAVLTAFLVLVYYAGRRHAGLLFLIATYAMWIAHVPPTSLSAPRIGLDPRGLLGFAKSGAAWILAGALGLSCAFTGHAYWTEGTAPYSGSQAAATFLRAHGLAGRTLVGYQDAPASSVLPYLPETRMWYAGSQRFGSHMMWDAEYIRNTEVPFEVALMRAELAFEDRSEILLLFNRELRGAERRGYRLLDSFPGAPPPREGTPWFGAQRESFFLYEPLPLGRSDLYRFWGETLRRLGETEESIDVLRSAVRADPTSGPARWALVLSFLDAGALEPAHRHFAELEGLAPAVPAKARLRGRFAAELAERGRVDAALEIVSSAIALAEAEGEGEAEGDAEGQAETDADADAEAEGELLRELISQREEYERRRNAGR